jgi:hypothetical protein
MGRRDRRKILDRVIVHFRSAARQDLIAQAYFALDDKENGFRWLESLRAARPGIFTKFDPKYDSVRSDPRFQTIIKRLNIPDPDRNR